MVVYLDPKLDLKVMPDLKDPDIESFIHTHLVLTYARHIVPE